MLMSQTMIVSARSIAIGETQQRTFVGSNDEDWLVVELRAGQTYLIETLALDPGVDTILELFDSGSALLRRNDDSDGLASRIGFQPERSAPYYIRVTNIGQAAFGDGYQVRARLW